MARSGRAARGAHFAAKRRRERLHRIHPSIHRHSCTATQPRARSTAERDQPHSSGTRSVLQRTTGVYYQVVLPGGTTRCYVAPWHAQWCTGPCRSRSEPLGGPPQRQCMALGRGGLQRGVGQSPTVGQETHRHRQVDQLPSTKTTKKNKDQGARHRRTPNHTSAGSSGRAAQRSAAQRSAAGTQRSGQTAPARLILGEMARERRAPVIA